MPATWPDSTSGSRWRRRLDDHTDEAFEEGSREMLLQALWLDPTTPSYQSAVHLIDEMCDLQENVLPTLEWHPCR